MRMPHEPRTFSPRGATMCAGLLPTRNTKRAKSPQRFESGITLFELVARDGWQVHDTIGGCVK